MKNIKTGYLAKCTGLVIMLIIVCCSNARQVPGGSIITTGLYSAGNLKQMMTKPSAMGEYIPSQAGPLRKPDGMGGYSFDSTFTVEKLIIPSGGLNITGWLYLPTGEQKCPLVVLTNGGGDGTRAIKSFSDFMAPILAHCGFAAFVHDKRGTGESEGDFAGTSYEDYITDAGNCGIFLSSHKRIDASRIGIMGASEGGRIAVVAASRFPVYSFVISQAGTMVSAIDDRLYAQINGMIDQGVMDEKDAERVKPLWIKSFQAWASNDPGEHEKADKEIAEWRKSYNRNLLPFTRAEMESIPQFRLLLPTWRSLGYDYMSEMAHFRKKWLAIFGEADRVVPTMESVKNIEQYMSVSGNMNYNIAVIPGMGHTPVDPETKQRINFDYIIINWLTENIAGAE